MANRYFLSQLIGCTYGEEDALATSSIPVGMIVQDLYRQQKKYPAYDSIVSDALFLFCAEAEISLWDESEHHNHILFFGKKSKEKCELVSNVKLTKDWRGDYFLERHIYIQKDVPDDVIDELQWYMGDTIIVHALHQ